MPDVILEDDVVGEVDVANWFYTLAGGKAGELSLGFGVAAFVGHALGHWALVVLHHLPEERILKSCSDRLRIVLRVSLELQAVSRYLASGQSVPALYILSHTIFGAVTSQLE